MDKEIKQPDIKRGPGRPKLPLDVKKERRRESVKKYKLKNPDKEATWNKTHKDNLKMKYRDVSILLPLEYSSILDKLISETGLSASELLVKDFEEKYVTPPTKKLT